MSPCWLCKPHLSLSKTVSVKCLWRCLVCRKPNQVPNSHAENLKCWWKSNSPPSPLICSRACLHHCYEISPSLQAEAVGLWPAIRSHSACQQTGTIPVSSRVQVSTWCSKHLNFSCDSYINWGLKAPYLSLDLFLRLTENYTESLPRKKDWALLRALMLCREAKAPLVCVLIHIQRSHSYHRTALRLEAEWLI